MTAYHKTVHRDANHKAVVTALRGAGMRVFDTAALGDGFPDLVVVRQDGRVFLLEVKSDIVSGASKLANEIEIMISLVSSSYRIMSTPEQAVAELMRAK